MADGPQDETAKPGEINGDALDRFTLVHFGAGVVMGAVGVPLWVIVAIALGWELVERPLKRKAPKMFPHSSQDTAPNAVVDIAACIAGGVIARRMLMRR